MLGYHKAVNVQVFRTGPDHSDRPNQKVWSNFSANLIFIAEFKREPPKLIQILYNIRATYNSLQSITWYESSADPPLIGGGGGMYMNLKQNKITFNISECKNFVRNYDRLSVFRLL